MPIQKITSGIIQDGAVAAADIVSVSNTAISGLITASQIAAVNGSVITANTIANSAIQTGAVENYMSAAGLGFGMRNRIINGAMVIDQRNAGASVTPTTGVFTLDRWLAGAYSASSKFSVQQNASAVTPPAGFKNYLGVTSLSAYSVAAGDFLTLQQSIEGYNSADLDWGTANAKTVTLSFWVRSSLTGTFGGALANSASDRSYPFSYTISVANTWEYKTVTIAGDTSGTWVGATNDIGINLRIGLGVGSTYTGTAGAWAGSNIFSVTGATSVVGTNGATFYITGVQLERGSTATSFDYRTYGTELALCQRYCFVHSITDDQATNGNQESFCVATSWGAQTTGTYRFPVVMRATPTVSFTSASTFARHIPAVVAEVAGTITGQSPRPYSCSLYATGYATTGATNGQCALFVVASNQTATITGSAEL